MNIKGSDIKADTRHRHGIEDDDVLVLRLAEFVPDVDMYAFWFNNQYGINLGLFWEDSLSPEVAEQLKKEE